MLYQSLYLFPYSSRVYQSALVVFIFCIALTNTVAAHHSHANLDRSDIQQHSGVVTEYSWTSPHVFLKVMAPNPAGEIVQYSIELVHPPGMLQRGWDKSSFKPGDRITWEGAADRNPERYYSGLNWAERGDGKYFTTEKQREAISPSTDLSGLWVRDLQGARPHYFPPDNWPYTDLAQSEVDSYNENQNPMLACETQGPPKATLLPYPIKFSWQDENTLLMEYELRDMTRIVHVNKEFPENPESSIWGYSIGHFEGQDLVVETRHFLANRWGNHTGVNSSTKKHLVEKISLSEDGLSLDINMTVTDPFYLQQPVVIEYHMAKMQDRSLIQVPCTVENARLFLEAGFE